MEDKSLQLIPKYERYIEYVLNYLDKIPRVDKFNIGNNFKNVMFNMFENIMYLNKVANKFKIDYCNKIDAEINIQRAYIRICYDRKIIDAKKYELSMEMLDEIGRMLGGYIKYLGLKV